MSRNRMNPKTIALAALSTLFFGVPCLADTLGDAEAMIQSQYQQGGIQDPSTEQVLDSMVHELRNITNPEERQILLQSLGDAISAFRGETITPEAADALASLLKGA